MKVGGEDGVGEGGGEYCCKCVGGHCHSSF